MREQWLILFWLEGSYITTSQKIWALCETQTLTWNFLSSAAAECSPVLLFLSVSVSFFIPLPCWSCYLLFIVLHYMLSLFISLSYLWLHLNSLKLRRPQRTTTTCAFMTSHKTVFALSNQRHAPSSAVTRCFAHLAWCFQVSLYIPSGHMCNTSMFLNQPNVEFPALPVSYLTGEVAIRPLLPGRTERLCGC